MTQCPDRDHLERLLDHRLADTELDEMEQHIEGCATCQQALEELTGDPVRGREPGRDGWITLIGPEPGPAVDPRDLTDGATTGNHERTARVVPTVAGYDLKGELGRGGMGVVYEARHVRLNRPCALKMILAGAHAGPEDVARFVTEAEAIARLQHPSIVQIRHIGDADGLPYLELEYVDGGSLDRQLDGTPWPATRAARLAELVALGIAEAHRQGIVHRDLKPSNVFLAADGTPKVGDFGLAKLMDRQAALTRSESVMGSSSYMAPEQASGHAREAGPPVDVYAVGAVLYELLTGRPPFRGTTANETIEQVKTTEPVPPSRLVPGVPRDVETICLKCLRKEPGKRYETAEALADDLRRFLDGRPILARPTSGVERAWRWCRRNRLVAAMTGIAAAALVMLAVGATVAAFAFRAAERRTQDNLLESLTEQARATRFSRQVGRRFESLDALDRAARIAHNLGLPPERFDRIRDQAIACLALPDLKPTGRGIDLPAGTIYFCFDPGMRRYALRLGSGTILVRRVADDQEFRRYQARGDRNISIFRFSPDGRYLTTTHVPGDGLTVWDLDRDRTVVDEPGPFAGTAARFSPDSRWIAVSHRDGKLVTYDLETGRPSRVRSGLGDVQDMAFRADGLRIAVIRGGAKRPTCLILDVESGRVAQTIPLRAISWWVAWSPDGATLATAGTDRRIDLWDVPSGNSRATLEGSTNDGISATFHPGGKLLASTGYDGRLRLWDAVLGRPVLSSTGYDSTGPVFGRDGQIVISSEDRLTTYQVDPALEYKALVHVSGEPMGYQRPSIRHDNRLLAVGSETGVVLWDLARGTECAFLPISRARSIMFEADGDLLTSGATGVRRWPIRLDSDRGEFRIGPPRDLPFSRTSGRIAQDRSGRIIASARETHAEVLISGRLTRVGPLDECRYVAVSPDGEWLATGSHHRDGQVRRVVDVEKVVKLPVNSRTSVSFSPDGKWLMTEEPPCRLWTAGTWALARELGGTGLCFSPDSRLVALQDASQIIRLVEADTGRVIAGLESPDSSNVIWATFSPDGSRLVLVPQNIQAVHVWDLRAVRKQLAEMKLDWEAPAFPNDDPAATSLPPLPPLQVDLGPSNSNTDAEAHIRLGDLLAGRGKWDEAVAEYRTAVRLKPDHADAHTNLGNTLKDQGQVDEAIAAYRAAVRLKPDDFWNRTRLGEALNEAGQRREAAAEFREAVRLAPNDGMDCFNMAIVMLDQGHTDPAIELLTRASRWDFEHNNRVGLAIEVLAETYRDLGRYDEAVANFRRIARHRGVRPEELRRADNEIALTEVQRRSHAARAAARAGCGLGKDKPPPDDAARAKLRAQALDWFKAELGRLAKARDTGPGEDRAGLTRSLEFWKRTADLAGVRDAAALSKLPDAERGAWRSLWAEVDALLARPGGSRP
jgi:eukaryotic-like serine/threonine-protein kinase